MERGVEKTVTVMVKIDSGDILEVMKGSVTRKDDFTSFSLWIMGALLLLNI